MQYERKRTFLTWLEQSKTTLQNFKQKTNQQLARNKQESKKQSKPLGQTKEAKSITISARFYNTGAILGLHRI